VRYGGYQDIKPGDVVRKLGWVLTPPLRGVGNSLSPSAFSLRCQHHRFTSHFLFARKSALISASQSYSQATRLSEHCETTDVRAVMSRDMPVYSLSFRQVLIPACTEGRLRLNRPGCLAPRRGGLPVQRRPKTVTHLCTTGPSVE